MKTIFCIALLCLSLLTGYAQAPGYMGKRFSAGYGFYFSPALIGSNGKGNTIAGTVDGHANDGTLAFNSLHEGFVEYTLTKKFTLGFSARFYKSTYDNSRAVSIADVPTSVNTGYYYGQQSQNPLGLYHIKGINLSLYGKLYFSRYIAPWGRYFIFGPTLKMFTCTYDPAEMKVTYAGMYGEPNIYYSNFGPTTQKFKGFDIMAGFGRNRIVANRITLDYGFNVNIFALLGTLLDAGGEDFSLSGNLYASDYIGRTSHARVRGVNRFNAFLKVGVLLF